MDFQTLTPDTALQLIGRLKQGRNVIFGADLFSVGREAFIKGADQVYEDLERTGDSVVRFIRGDYGVGKTNFAARIFHSALCRGWIGVYVELSEQVRLNEFHEVFSEIVKNMYAPEQMGPHALNGLQPLGLMGVLDLHYKRLRKAVGLGPGSDLPASVRTDISARIGAILQKHRVYGDFASAVRAYFDARIDNDAATIALLNRWFLADPDIKMPARGILRPISKINGKEYLRALSCLLVGMNHKGMLIVMDELESIMEESKGRRRKAYTILRELMDNVDGENGMRNTCFYVAAPPGQFESQKGFIEVEPLASRIQAPIVVAPGEIDSTATVIDLDRSPLTLKEQVQLGKKLREIHGIARSWDAHHHFTDAILTDLVNEIEKKRPYANLRIREFCIEIIGALDRKHGSISTLSGTRG